MVLMVSGKGLENRLNVNESKKISDKIAIATTTWYNPDLESDIIRADSAKKSVRTAIDLGYIVVVVDGGSSDELLREFERYGAKVYHQIAKGMGPGRREAIAQIHDIRRPVEVWTEPEKENYILQIWKTAIPILDSSADLVIPKRMSLRSYPIVQQFTEKIGNFYWKSLTGHDLDMWSGPRTWHNDIAHYFLNYKGRYEDKWDSIFIPVMDAIFDGKKVIGVDVEYIHPKKQTEIENNITFHKKRFEQLFSLTSAFRNHRKEHYSVR